MMGEPMLSKHTPEARGAIFKVNTFHRVEFLDFLLSFVFPFN
jgi:hypothetical protein